MDRRLSQSSAVGYFFWAKHRQVKLNLGFVDNQIQLITKRKPNALNIFYTSNKDKNKNNINFIQFCSWFQQVVSSVLKDNQTE